MMATQLGRARAAGTERETVELEYLNVQCAGTCGMAGHASSPKCLPLPRSRIRVRDRALPTADISASWRWIPYALKNYFLTLFHMRAACEQRDDVRRWFDHTGMAESRIIVASHS